MKFYNCDVIAVCKKESDAIRFIKKITKKDIHFKTIGFLISDSPNDTLRINDNDYIIYKDRENKNYYYIEEKTRLRFENSLML